MAKEPKEMSYAELAYEMWKREDSLDHLMEGQNGATRRRASPLERPLHACISYHCCDSGDCVGVLGILRLPQCNCKLVE